MSVKGSLKSMLYYGNERGDLDTLLDPSSSSRMDVVITTYGTLSSEHLKWVKNKDKSSYEGGSLFDGERGPLIRVWQFAEASSYVSVEWLRVVLGEFRRNGGLAANSDTPVLTYRCHRRSAHDQEPDVSRGEGVL
jgi:hypothetical protein